MEPNNFGWPFTNGFFINNPDLNRNSDEEDQYPQNPMIPTFLPNMNRPQMVMNPYFYNVRPYDDYNEIRNIFRSNEVPVMEVPNRRREVKKISKLMETKFDETIPNKEFKPTNISTIKKLEKPSKNTSIDDIIAMFKRSPDLQKFKENYDSLKVFSTNTDDILKQLTEEIKHCSQTLKMIKESNETTQ